MTTVLDQILMAVEQRRLSAAAANNLRTWLTQPQYSGFQPRLRQLVEADDFKTLQDAFWEKIPFGTGGRRGPMGELGTATMNARTIAESAHGVAMYVKESLPTEWQRIVIAHDTRLRSAEFARITATTFAAHGLKTFLFPAHRSTPELSFAVRELRCGAGAMITASHNPPSDNGFKVYGRGGGQVLDDEAIRIIAHVEAAEQIPECDFHAALADGRIELVGEEVDHAFIRAVISMSLTPGHDVVALYSPCHGVGETSVFRAIRAAGFERVEIDPAQRLPDGNFPFAPDHFPNPERRQVLDALVPRANQIGAEMILASDPDADRMGLSVRSSRGDFVTLSGNRIGALLADYILRTRRNNRSLTAQHFVATTLVTTPLIDVLARKYGVRSICDLLVGFKYIGAVMDHHGPERFVFGCEESLGYLAGTYARDKDATIAALYLLELAADLKAQGRTLLDRLDELFAEHGYFCDSQLSKTCVGEAGRLQIQSLTSVLRTSPPVSIGPARLTQVRDYQQHEVRLLPENHRCADLPQPDGDLLIFDGLVEHLGTTTAVRIAARPSGTEPKIKFYLFAHPAVGSCDHIALDEIKPMRDAILSNMQQALSQWVDGQVSES